MHPNDELLKTIPAFREGIPALVRFAVLLVFVIIFQCSGGIYLASVSQMMGTTALMHEDIMMAGYASFVGMTLIFPVLFPLKFRFSSRTIFLTVSSGLVICNMITLNTTSLPVMTGCCFIAGALRMWGTFECFSSMQLRITPTRNFAVFFPVVYTVVLGSVQISGILTVRLAYFYEWQYMHYMIIGGLLIIALLACLLMRPFHVMKPLPLSGIDWLGGILWSIILLLIVFVFEYGEFYDWFDSGYIRAALFAAFVLGLINIYRMRTLKNPYICIRTFRYPHIMTILFLFAAMYMVLLATPTVLQNAYIGILHYDSLNAISLNWAVFAGIVAGALFTWLALVRYHVKYKPLVFLGLALMVGYQVFFYFLISPDMNNELLFLPLMMRGAGNVMMYIVLTVYASQVIPFQHFFQALSLMGFIRSGVGSPIGTAFINRLFIVLHKENLLSLSSELDAQNPVTGHLSFNAIYGELERQALMVSIKQVFGYVAIFGILLLMAALLTKYRVINKYVKMPVFTFPRRLREIKIFHRPRYTVEELVNGQTEKE